MIAGRFSIVMAFLSAFCLLTEQLMCIPLAVVGIVAGIRSIPISTTGRSGLILSVVVLIAAAAFFIIW